MEEAPPSGEVSQTTTVSPADTVIPNVDNNNNIDPPFPHSTTETMSSPHVVNDTDVVGEATNETTAGGGSSASVETADLLDFSTPLTTSTDDLTQFASAVTSLDTSPSETTAQAVSEQQQCETNLMDFVPTTSADAAAAAASVTPECATKNVRQTILTKTAAPLESSSSTTSSSTNANDSQPHSLETSQDDDTVILDDGSMMAFSSTATTTTLGGGSNPNIIEEGHIQQEYADPTAMSKDSTSVLDLLSSSNVPPNSTVDNNDIDKMTHVSATLPTASLHSNDDAETHNSAATTTTIDAETVAEKDNSTMKNNGASSPAQDSTEQANNGKSRSTTSPPQKTTSDITSTVIVESTTGTAVGIDASTQENEGMTEVALNNVQSLEQTATLQVEEQQQRMVDPWLSTNDHAAADAVGGGDVVTSNLESVVSEQSNAMSGEGTATTSSAKAKELSGPTIVDLPISQKSTAADDANEGNDCAEKDALLVELQSSLQDHMTRQAEAEDRARQAEARLKQLEGQVQGKEQAETDLQAMKDRMKAVVLDKANLELELAKLRNSRDEHERKEIVLSNRLNAAKKKEAVKADLAERLEDEVKALQTELSSTKDKLSESEASRARVEQELEKTKSELTERVRVAETALGDERRLNEDRKKKMKAFIESKQEEVRQGKLQTDELNAELEQTSRLLREQNSRWKQLHAQWVQSQTRNRELQRDLNRIKKDSDNMHKIGDKMEQKLSKSAQETEEHKNKRLTAKHELMTILRTLEGEREVSSRLRDSLKFTFTPKAISQQQLLKESLQDFDAELQRLSRRLGRPLPPSIDSPALFSDDDTHENAAGASVDIGDNGESSEEGKDGTLNRSELDSNNLISNLEHETQRVSQCIMALTSSIERMHVVLDERGPSNCVNAFTNLLMGGSTSQSTTNSSASQGERASMTSMRSTRYGQIPTS